MCRLKARLSRSANAVGMRSRGLDLILSVKIWVAVSGECARERRAWAGCEGAVDSVVGRGDGAMKLVSLLIGFD